MGTKKPTVIDLFCGCGGLSHGFKLAGYDILLGIDNDSAALKTFELNHSGAKALSVDITNMSGKHITDIVGRKKIDVVIGGPPCQGFSLSGPRKFYDSRNKLYLSFIKLVKEIKPKCFLIENVPGIIGLYGGQIKEQIVAKFSELGYTVTCSKLNSADFGVPQLRNRVFFVGLLNSDIGFEFPRPLFDKKNYITAKDATDDLPGLEDEMDLDPVPYLPLRKLTKYQKYCRQDSVHIHNHIATKHNEKTKFIISHVPEGGNYKDLPGKYRTTRNFHVAWTRFHSKKPSPTIDTGHRHHFHYKYNRVPTVRESARLQSFSDLFIFIGNKSQQYRQVGNAVPPLLAKTIAEKLKNYL